MDIGRQIIGVLFQILQVQLCLLGRLAEFLVFLFRLSRRPFGHNLLFLQFGKRGLQGSHRRFQISYELFLTCQIFTQTGQAGL